MEKSLATYIGWRRLEAWGGGLWHTLGHVFLVGGELLVQQQVLRHFARAHQVQLRHARSRLARFPRRYGGSQTESRAHAWPCVATRHVMEEEIDVTVELTTLK